MKSNEIILDEVAKAEGYHDSVDMICVADSIDPVYLAMDEYAKQQAIAFADYIAFRHKPHDIDTWDEGKLNTHELFDNFIQSQFNKPASHVDAPNP